MRDITEEDFRGYPDTVTTLPLYDDEDGRLFGWGHLDRQEVKEAVRAIYVHYDLDPEDFDLTEDHDISHTYAKPYPIDGFEEDDIAFVPCLAEDDGAFPITVVF